jgi:hypothetical protein
VIRSCVACRGRATPALLTRLPVLADRGVWIHPRRACLARLPSIAPHLSKRLGVRVDAAELAESVNFKLLRQTSGWLVCARRSGAVVTGRARVVQLGPEFAIFAARESALSGVSALGCLPWSAAVIGELLGCGPRALIGIRRSRRNQDLLERLRWLCDLG